jgi:hypothetical protein
MWRQGMFPAFYDSFRGISILGWLVSGEPSSNPEFGVMLQLHTLGYQVYCLLLLFGTGLCELFRDPRTKIQH